MLRFLHRPVSSTAALVVLSLASVQACSPGWTPDVFVRKYRPDVPKEFYAGKLGVLEETYYRFSLISAYRYLNGGVIAASELVPDDPASPQSEEEDPHADGSRQDPQVSGAQQWPKVRNALAATQISEYMQTSRPVPGTNKDQYLSFENCYDAAFDNAAATLKARAAAWGEKSAAVATWIANQDAVFSNCHEDKQVQLPAAPPASAPLLLKQDTAYQAAAANFYALRYDAARAGFAAISQDSSSPWHGLAAYLAARTTVRQAMLVPPAPAAASAVTFDRPRLEEAVQELNMLRKVPRVPALAVEHELGYVQSQLDPNRRIRAVSAALAGPKPDPNFQQDLTDLVLLLNQRLDTDLAESDREWMSEPERKQAEVRDAEKFKQLDELRSLGPMVDWLITFQSRTDAARQHAVEEWKSTHALPWLVAAITKAEPRDTDTPALLQAAAKVPASSPAWESITYHRARILAMDDPAGARALLDPTLVKVKADGPDSAINAFTGLRMTAATSLADFLAYVPRHMLVGTSQPASATIGCRSCDTTIAPMQLSGDAAGFFNRQAPIEMWEESARSTALPASIRRALLLSGWTRAVILEDAAAMAGFAAIQSAGGRGKGDPVLPAAAGLTAWLTMLRNPGLSYTLDDGVQRSQTAATLDSFGDNWWSNTWITHGVNTATMPASFLSTADAQKAQSQIQILLKAGNATTWLGRRVIDYAKANPGDPSVPEALHLVVRASRYGPADKAISREAFDLLHHAYPSSPWTTKTPYYF